MLPQKRSAGNLNEAKSSGILMEYSCSIWQVLVFPIPYTSGMYQKQIRIVLFYNLVHRFHLSIGLETGL
jgi:hypothetical protein